ncbi:hypothetical protein PIB30_061086 [Stylosanthes scabra]|uniref:RNase H type-1 domain-containing protein n=1 Tax=Stylosanthes scabra TaxID=79078 RepID=A0ABU6TME0_9FABA|nr:hypothetical protein [Stylosanthes scabra]
MTCKLLGTSEEKVIQEAYGQYKRLKGVVLTTKHVANAVLFLVSNDSEFVTGHDLVVDDTAIELDSGAFLEMILVVESSVGQEISLYGPSFVSILSLDSASVDNDLLHKIRDMLHWSWTVQFRLIKREANAIADWLAKRGAMGDADLITWIEPGEYLRSLLKHDITALL